MRLYKGFEWDFNISEWDLNGKVLFNLFTPRMGTGIYPIIPYHHTMIEESIGTETLLRLPGDGTTNSSTDRHLEMLKKTRLKVGITDVHERWFLLFSLYLIKILYTFQSICPV